MNTKTYLLNNVIPVDKNQGFGWSNKELLTSGLDYDVTGLKVDDNYPNKYFFQLYDNQGWIGDYRVDKKIWNDNVEEMK